MHKKKKYVKSFQNFCDQHNGFLNVTHRNKMCPVINDAATIQGDHF